METRRRSRIRLRRKVIKTLKRLKIRRWRTVSRIKKRRTSKKRRMLKMLMRTSDGSAGSLSMTVAAW